MTPKTIQGCRPVSVKIQPKLLANNGSSGVARIAQNHRRWRGIRSRRVDHNTAMAIKAPTIPSPIMIRNDQ